MGKREVGKLATKFIAYDGSEARDPEFMKYVEESMTSRLAEGVAQKYGKGEEIILSFKKTEKMEPKPEMYAVGFYKMAKIEELVRCKDCIYFHLYKVYYSDDASVPPLIGNHVCDKWGQDCRTDPDGFCYMGERRENGEL